MIQQKINSFSFIIPSSSPIFCLAIPENLIASSFLLHTKKTASFSEILHFFNKLEIPDSVKNFAIGPFPLTLLLDFSFV